MIVYNVTVKIDTEVHKDWLQWITNVHIPDVMATGCFTEYRLLQVLNEEKDGFTYSVQYHCENMANLYWYQKNHAPALQQEHEERYKDKFTAFRTVLKEL